MRAALPGLFRGMVRTLGDGHLRSIFIPEQHECNAYCRPPRHAEVVYRGAHHGMGEAPVTSREVQLTADLPEQLGMRRREPTPQVLDVQPAPETPLPECCTSAWLVTYEIPEGNTDLATRGVGWSPGVGGAVCSVNEIEAAADLEAER